MIKVLLFAQLQEEAKTDVIEIDFQEGTVAELKNMLQSQFKLSQLSESMIAINEAYALEQDMVRNGDTVAIIPPVSGG
ncbi:molybdopterin converting factor subunit 1 [Gracilibacillus caseinilyticus]|uniref:Molybdopterin synthase sulfur carrier subunit n=1 Tax=Gracilibacillus caseinilyticus TaxID=2932256 RepID=A0ABY4EV45_9BACI|nr:molybdopterin converting factor subunit 1 [Gracilibacillus caseinilyticus]UOQ48154.1 molybdopterin converting factor subunit 1 [Gracilibacillus caseinilyticus]